MFTLSAWTGYRAKFKKENENNKKTNYNKIQVNHLPLVRISDVMRSVRASDPKLG